MYLIPIMSHLLQMRGLKQAFESGKDLNTVSHLLQMRGLKHNRTVSHITYFGSHLLQMRGLKLVFLALLVLISVSHLLQMRGLKLKRTEHNKVTQSRIFYRCVD